MTIAEETTASREGEALVVPAGALFKDDDDARDVGGRAAEAREDDKERSTNAEVDSEDVAQASEHGKDSNLSKLFCRMEQTRRARSEQALERKRKKTERRKKENSTASATEHASLFPHSHASNLNSHSRFLAAATAAPTAAAKTAPSFVASTVNNNSNNPVAAAAARTLLTHPGGVGGTRAGLAVPSLDLELSTGESRHDRLRGERLRHPRAHVRRGEGYLEVCDGSQDARGGQRTLEEAPQEKGERWNEWR